MAGYVNCVPTIMGSDHRGPADLKLSMKTQHGGSIINMKTILCFSAITLTAQRSRHAQPSGSPTSSLAVAGSLRTSVHELGAATHVPPGSRICCSNTSSVKSCRPVSAANLRLGKEG